MSISLPSHAATIVIGGGVVGCSTAYHLAREHRRDVILLEQNVLTSGSTWHAAGLVGQLRSSAAITRLLQQSVALYSRLEAETGLSTGWKMTGCIRLATNLDRMIEYRRLATVARSFGLEMHLLSTSEVAAMWPLMAVDDIVGASFLPSDGQVNPSDLTQALAKGARMNGARIIEGVRVTGFTVSGRRVSAVVTDQGPIRCDHVVNCAGHWARRLGAIAGTNVPLQPLKHQYLITERIDGVTPTLPTVRDPDHRTYFKGEVGGLVMGGYEPNPIAWTSEDLEGSSSFQLFDDDWDHFEQHMNAAIARVPALRSAGIKKMINALESFTPDGNFILGRVPELANYFVGAGFNAFGIASAGGTGQALAEWIATGEAPMDLWPVDIRRFSAAQSDDRWICARTLEAYRKHYSIAYPHLEFESGRCLRVSPLYARLRGLNAVFGTKLGWERANWFAPTAEDAKDIPTMGWPNWHPFVSAEHRRTREAVSIFDQSSFAKFELRGREAVNALSWICANDVTKPIGRVTYTQMLNSRGGIECDLTVTRLSDQSFYLVTGTGSLVHDGAWIRDHIGAFDATLSDITEAIATLSVMGPRSRELISCLTQDDLSNAAFPFGHAREIRVAGRKARAIRITYVGELGWELHVANSDVSAMFDALMNAGKPFAAAPAGYRAIESLRLEKGYRSWGSDIGPNDSPFEAGLGFAVKLKSPFKFVGREASEANCRKPLDKMLVGFTCDRPETILIGGETILRNREPVGYLTSGGFGHTIGRPIGYGYLRHPQGVSDTWAQSGQYELAVAEEPEPCRIHFAPLWDPFGMRIRA
jgi:4-methylaminobutanoate oxidase (formaldehyde-forming)